VIRACPYRQWRNRAVLAAFALAAVPAPAADGAAGPVLGVAQMVLGLALVLGLIVLASWLLRRFGAGPAATGSLVRVVTAASVGPRERVVLVEIGDTWLVLGVAPGRINALHQLARQQLAQPDGQPQGFAYWLGQARRRHQPPAPSASE
jgi:flagellar protein FliO/FliZ